MDILIPAIVIMLLVLLNGMFVAAEFAIIGIRQSRIAQLANEGHGVAQRLLGTLEDRSKVDRYIASAQLGITLASLGLGMYGEPAIAHLLEEPLHDWFGLSGDAVHTVAFIIGLSIVTYLHVVIGEMVPKSLALQFAERTVMVLFQPMRLMQLIFRYPITALNAIGLWVLKVLGVPPPQEKSRLHTSDELEMIISEGVVGGLIAAQDFTLFENIFDLSELEAHQMMTPRVQVDAVPLDISEVDLTKKLLSSAHTRLPVYAGDVDHIVGILHLKDFVKYQLEGTPFDLRQLMDEPVYLPESATAYELLATFEQRQVHIAVVVGEYGGTAGIVTLEDLLEEVVGEVWDEFDRDVTAPVTAVAPGHLLVKGSAQLHELGRYVDLSRFEKGVDSVGGLVLANVSLPPRRGATVQLDDVSLRIEAVDGMTVERVAVTYPPPAVQEEDGGETAVH